MSDRFYPAGMKASSQAYEALMDRWMAVLTGAELKVLMYISRRTVGFGKREDAISLSQFCGGITTRDGRELDGGTGLTREAALSAVRKLERRDLIIRTVRANKLPALYAVNWATVMQGPQEPTSRKSRPVASRKIRPVPVGKTDPQQSVVQEAGFQETDGQETALLDYLPRSRKQRDNSAGGGCVSLEEMKRLCESYFFPGAQYGNTVPERMPDKVAQKAVAAANGATLTDVQEFLRAKFSERGGRYQPDKPLGPRSWAWFPAVFREHFGRYDLQALVGYDRSQNRKAGGSK